MLNNMHAHYAHYDMQVLVGAPAWHINIHEPWDLHLLTCKWIIRSWMYVPKDIAYSMVYF